MPRDSIRPLAQHRGRSERPFRGRDIARDQDDARDGGLAARPCQKIIERLARRHFARGNVRHRIEPARRNAAAVSMLWR